MNQVAGWSVLTVAVLWALEAGSEPELGVFPGPQPARPSRVYPIVCEVRWQGEPDKYLVLPPQVSPIDWGRVEVMESRCATRDGLNVVSFRVGITPESRGEFETPEITVSFLSPEDLQMPAPSGEPASPTPAPTAPDAFPHLRADPFTLRVSPNTDLTWIAGILGALLLSLGAALAGLLVRKRKRTGRPVVARDAIPARIAEALKTFHESKRHLIEGSYYEFYQTLARTAELAGFVSGDLLNTLRRRVEDVGYRGLRPSPDQMDGDLRAVERALASCGRDNP